MCKQNKHTQNITRLSFPLSLSTKDEIHGGEEQQQLRRNLIVAAVKSNNRFASDGNNNNTRCSMGRSEKIKLISRTVNGGDFIPVSPSSDIADDGRSSQ